MTDVRPVIPVYPPVRVLEDGFGTARAPSHAKKAPDVVLVRDDLWTLGAPLELAGDAFDLWPAEWIAFALREDVDGRGRWVLRPMRSFDRLVERLREKKA